MSAIASFALPDLGEGLTDAELVRWEVAVGDVIELNQVIAEVETAKASVELPSPYAGTVVRLHAAEGDTVDVGSPFIDVEVEAGASDEQPPESEPAAVQTPTEERADTDSGPDRDAAEGSGRTPVLVGYGVAEETVSRRRKAGADDASPRRDAAEQAPAGRPLASPPVRKAAREADVDLADVPATGLHGEVTRADLERFLVADTTETETTADETAADEPSIAAGEVRTPIRGVRKHTAEAMVRSAFTAPHVTEFVDVDVTATMELVARLGAHRQFDGVRLTPLAVVAKALLAALRTNPSLNSSWDEQAQEIVTKHYVNLGIAAATPRGLLVPNIKNAQAMSLRDLAVALADLTAVAKEGKTAPADLLGGTISITNIGVFGIDSGTPIINPGEAAILCFGAVRRRPWEWEGEIALRQVTTLSLSFDHRLVDGEQGSTFLAAVADMLADPLSLIALG
ncbi:MAG: dihydrolipoamide acetyltransferase family protein [Gordonia sp. (in: high G+C Gram-positive bacteria)]|uniref:dihydrolipoamide acetyltransferase family protein n=1 Tax=Gordonia sp. (in: high G+C Gram-positive bacteria) TaxID=84139 RepID=UPI003C70ADC8